MSGTRLIFDYYHSPASGLAKLALMALAGEVLIEITYPTGLNAAQRKEYMSTKILREGAGLDIDGQTSKTKFTGGSFLTYTGIGRICVPENKPTTWKDFGRRYVLQLQGLPNKGRDANFPALAYQIEGGTRQYRQSGQQSNAAGVFRVPTVEDSVLVPVPASEEAAHKIGWTMADGWRDAQPLMVDRWVLRAVNAAAEVLINTHWTTYHSAPSDEQIEEFTTQAADATAKNIETITEDVTAYLKKMRTRQEEVCLPIYRTFAWWKKANGMAVTLPKRNIRNLPDVAKALDKIAADAASLPAVEAITDVEPTDDVEPTEYNEPIGDTDADLREWEDVLNGVAPTTDPWATATPTATVVAEPVIVAVPVVAA